MSIGATKPNNQRLVLGLLVTAYALNFVDRSIVASVGQAIKLDLKLTDTQLGCDLHGCLDKVRQGAEVIVEENSRPVALITSPVRAGRSLSECIALAKAEQRKFAQPPVPDLEFAADVRAAVSAHDTPLEPTAWD